MASKPNRTLKHGLVALQKIKLVLHCICVQNLLCHLASSSAEKNQVRTFLGNLRVSATHKDGRYERHEFALSHACAICLPLRPPLWNTMVDIESNTIKLSSYVLVDMQSSDNHGCIAGTASNHSASTRIQRNHKECNQVIRTSSPANTYNMKKKKLKGKRWETASAQQLDVRGAPIFLRFARQPNPGHSDPM